MKQLENARISLKNVSILISKWNGRELKNNKWKLKEQYVSILISKWNGREYHIRGLGWLIDNKFQS